MGCDFLLIELYLAFVSNIYVYAKRNHMCSTGHSIQYGHMLIIFVWNNLMESETHLTKGSWPTFHNKADTM